jgi:hypothetical protein
MSESDLLPSGVYTGQCHCGYVLFLLRLHTPQQPVTETKVMNCNCTLCTRNGYFNVYPERKNIKIFAKDFKKGFDEPWNGIWVERAGLKRYTIEEESEDKKESCTHLFCGKCGASMFTLPREGVEGGEGEDVAVNVSFLRSILAMKKRRENGLIFCNRRE